MEPKPGYESSYPSPNETHSPKTLREAFDYQYTQFPNDILDYIMPTVSGSAWKALSFIVRKTLGWHKDTDSISMGQIVSGCGITKKTVIRVIQELEEDSPGGKLITVMRRTDGSNGHVANLYTINLDYDYTHLIIDADGKNDTRGTSRTPSSKNDTTPSVKITPTKETIQKKERSLSFSNENDTPDNKDCDKQAAAAASTQDSNNARASFVKCADCTADASTTVGIDTKGRCSYCLVVAGWKYFFPKGVKSHPKVTTASYRKKVGARWKDGDFREGWWTALEIASKSPTLVLQSWFDFSWFVKNDENWSKLLAEPHHWMHWKDEREFSADLRAMQRGQLTAAQLVARKAGKKAASYAPLASSEQEGGGGWSPLG